MNNSYPEHIIKNSNITAKICLPDSHNGYYQGRRFEWCGNIHDLTWKGHVVFSPWTPYLGPENFESVAGPMEEFCLGQDDSLGGPGYAEAKPGEPWLKIGVGILEKSSKPEYSIAEVYPIIDGGKWSSDAGSDFISSTQDLSFPEKGWGYLYTKKIRLNESSLILSHKLKNTGTETLDFMQYNHNFFTLDGSTAGPDYEITFPYEITGEKEYPGVYRIEGKTISYDGPLTDGGMMTYIRGDFGREGYQFFIRNNRTGLQVDVTCDTPMEILKFWSCDTTVCPEPYIRRECKPGETVNWEIVYSFKEDLK